MLSDLPYVGGMFFSHHPVVYISLGLVLATQATTLPAMYATFGAMTVGGSIFLSYIGHTAFLPNNFAITEIEYAWGCGHGCCTESTA